MSAFGLQDVGGSLGWMARMCAPNWF